MLDFTWDPCAPRAAPRGRASVPHPQVKHELDLRPLYHWLDERIRAHVLLRWLVLLLVRVVETETGVSWAVARDAFEDLALVTLEGKDGRFELLSTSPSNSATS